MKKHQLSHRKLVLLPEADGGDLCEADGSELATDRFPRMTQLPPSFSEAFHTAKTFFFLVASQLKAKELKSFQEDDPFHKYYTVVM